MSKPAKKTTASKQVKKTTTAKKVAAPSTPAPVENVVAAPEVVAEPVPFSGLTQVMTDFQSSIQAAINQLNALKAEYRALEKKVQRRARCTKGSC